MIFRIIRETLVRRKKQAALVFVAVLFGAATASALLTVYGDITARMSQELRSFGANILVRPRTEALELEIGGVNYTPAEARTYLDERELARAKTIFWKNNITGFAPFLSVVASVEGQPLLLTGTWFEKQVPVPQLTPRQFADRSAKTEEPGVFVTGVKSISPWWDVEGRWVEEGELGAAIVGSSLAEKLALSAGDSFTVAYGDETAALTVAGILRTGGFEEGQAFVNLPVVQRLVGISYGVDRVLVSAMVTPQDRVSDSIKGKTPGQMTSLEFETWYCTPLIESISYQIEEVISGSQAGPIRQISEAESTFVGKTELLVLLITGIGLASSALGVMAAMSTMVMQRRKDIGLMKAIGAQSSQVAWIFLLEAGLIGLLGGLAGYGVGFLLAQLIGRGVFGVSFSLSPLAFPLTMMLALSVALAGSILPVRQAVKVQPVELLRGGG